MHQVQSEILQSVDVEDIESALRGCLLKLQYANASLGPCKEGKLSAVSSPSVPSHHNRSSRIAGRGLGHPHCTVLTNASLALK